MRRWEYVVSTLSEDYSEVFNEAVEVDTGYLESVEWREWLRTVDSTLTFEEFLRLWVKSKRAKEVF